MHEVRRQIDRHVREHPGIHFNAIVEELDLGVGQVQYHTRRLLGEGHLVRESLHGRTHYYPDRYDAWERGAIAMLRRETARDVVVLLVEYDEVAPSFAAERLDVARSTLEWHVSNLVERDVVEKHYDDGGRVFLHLTRPGDVERLLAEVSPSVPDRLVDRFTRLVDKALEGGSFEDRPNERR